MNFKVCVVGLCLILRTYPGLPRNYLESLGDFPIGNFGVWSVNV